MGADNVDIFKKIIFSLPPLKYQITGIFVLGLIYTLASFIAFEAFAPINIASMLIPLFYLLIFVFPTLLAGELFCRVLNKYPRDWSFFLALVNQLSLFLYIMVLSGANNAVNAWNIVWLLLITLYLINVLVLVMSVGFEYIKKIALISFVQPASLAAIFYFFIGDALEISTYDYVFSFASFLAASAFLLAILVIVDYLIKTNTDVSAFTLTSRLLQNRREALDLGFESRPEVQTLKIDNGEESIFLAPWVHPGPLAGFGGGKVSEKIISELNESGRGFFFHVPCTHKEDLADPNDSEKLLDSVSNPELADNASKIIRREYEKVQFYGRKIGDNKVVYMIADGIDDYDVGIFTEDIDLEDVLLVDLHNHDIQQGPEKEVQYGTVEASELKQSFDQFLKELDGQELEEYHAGVKVSEDRDLVALTEKVGDQETLLIGSDTNGITKDLRDLKSDYESNFDYSLVFSTDTHSSIHEMANLKSTDTEEVKSLVEASKKDLSPAQIGLGTMKSDPVKLLKYDYNGLVSSVNILIRLVVISLFIFYLLLVLWIF
ncbi:MAG: DUF2070 family protein [Candidatus Nanohaloarchaea archaeon]